jgi:hypothetical protein
MSTEAGNLEAAFGERGRKVGAGSMTDKDLYNVIKDQGLPKDPGGQSSLIPQLPPSPPAHAGLAR